MLLIHNNKDNMKYTMIDGVLHRILPVPTTKGQLKTSSVWNAGRSRVRPCHNPKVLSSYLTRKRMLGSVPYGKEPVPRNS